MPIWHAIAYVYIDQGAGGRVSKQAAAAPPTVIDHREFAYWLRGVAQLRHPGRYDHQVPTA
jgi:hypothetical protein